LIETGRVLTPLEHKEIILLDAAAFSANNDDQGSFEREFIKVMNDAVHAGNLIVVFPEFTTLARSAETMGSNLAGLIEPYLASANLQIIAFATTDEFHRVWESRAEVMEKFIERLLDEIYLINSSTLLFTAYRGSDTKKYHFKDFASGSLFREIVNEIGERAPGCDTVPRGPTSPGSHETKAAIHENLSGILFSAR